MVPLRNWEAECFVSIYDALRENELYRGLDTGGEVQLVEARKREKGRVERRESYVLQPEGLYLSNEYSKQHCLALVGVAQLVEHNPVHLRSPVRFPVCQGIYTGCRFNP